MIAHWEYVLEGLAVVEARDGALEQLTFATNRRPQAGPFRPAGHDVGL
jgi:hypothetical protein